MLRGRLARGALLRDAGWLWGAEAVGLMANVLQGVLVARWLGPRAYGVAALAVTFPTLVFSFIDANSQQATVKYLGEFQEKGDKSKAIAMTRLGYMADASVGLLALFLVAATAPWAQSHIMKSSGMGTLAVIYSAGLLLRAPSSTSSALLSTFSKFSLLALAKSANLVFRSALIIALVASGWGIRGVVIGGAVGLALEGMLLTLMAYPQARKAWGRPTFKDSWVALKDRRREIARFLLWTDLGTSLNLVTNQADILILGFFRGPTEVGFYRLARSISSLGSSVVGPLQSVVFPRLARMWGRRDRMGLRRAAKIYLFGLGGPLAALALACLALVPAVIQRAVGRRFLPAAPAAQILIAGVAVWMALFWLRPMFFALGRVRFWTLNAAWVSVLALIGFVFLGANQGYIGISWVQFGVAAAGHLGAVTYLLTRSELANRGG